MKNEKQTKQEAPHVSVRPYCGSDLGLWREKN